MILKKKVSKLMVMIAFFLIVGLISPLSIQAQPLQSVKHQPTRISNKNKHKNPTSKITNKYQLANKIIKTGEKYLGVPYRLGALTGSTKEFDCSSFVQFVYKKNGIQLPRSAREQARIGVTVHRSKLQKGDLVFFKSSKSNGNIGHIGIYAGNNKVLHTYGPNGVRYDSMKTGWLNSGFLLAKRVI